ncbi:MAG: glycoside hydrolase family 9 protein [Thermoflexales bacterium]|nr:glycoside hydrolase family 9 protein [Thermoflexales bacterium]
MNKTGLTINDQDYFEMPGLNVFVYQNAFSEGHQGGVEIIQHGERVATNGELRLSPAPGQWQPVPEVGWGFHQESCAPKAVALQGRAVDREANTISMPCRYPDKSRERKGFNPIIYPDLQIDYTVRVQAEGTSFTITVDLKEPLPQAWVGRVGYSLELFPGDLYGKSYYMDAQPGAFPRQANGPTYKNPDGEAEAVPMAEGHTLVVAPEDELFRMTIESPSVPLQLLDGSLKHNNGWFVVHSLVPAGATQNAIQWKITLHVLPGWTYQPVIHVSQVGYHPRQKKVAYIELDKRESALQPVTLHQVMPSGEYRLVAEKRPAAWGPFLRYQYATLDFSEIAEAGIYVITYGDVRSNPFQIDAKVYKRHVWQPTLEYFLPMQMCHMRVNQKYRVWHGLCHMDDALMAPSNVNHFDGYGNLDETATFPFQALEHIPALDAGGWHDAGDDDIRTDTQINTIMALAHTYEEFGIDYDETTIDQEHRHVEIHQPDGKPDILQQIEHGVLWILSFYRQFGSLGFGVIVPTLRQYVHLGDPSTQTDNRVVDAAVAQSRAARVEGLWYKKVANRYSRIFDPEENLDEIEEFVPELDDRLAFPQTNPGRQLLVSAGLAMAARVLKGYNDALAGDCLRVAETLWAANRHFSDSDAGLVHAYGRYGGLESLRIAALAELILTTKKEEYKKELCGMGAAVEKHFGASGWALGRVMPLLDCPEFRDQVTAAARAFQAEIERSASETPFGCRLAHTEILGLMHYFLHKGWPEIFSADPMFAVMNFLLGCRPGKTTNSLVSGVGVNSPVVAYGFNRADWSYIPGGTFWNAVNVLSPDFAEDKVWPYLWQEREYITDAACMFMFTVIAADKLLEE